METKDKTILVTGSTGHQGGAVVRHLLKDGWKVCALTRNPEKIEAKELKNLGADVVKGDLTEKASLEKLLEGVYGVFSVQQPLEHGVDSEIMQGKALADAAKKAGVKHFVYSSVGSAETKTGIPFFDSKAEIEDHIKSLDLNYTILRPVYFMENLSDPAIRDKIYDGVLYLPLGPDVSLQLISVDDIGAFTALAFRKPEEFSKTELDIAGDELTGPEMATILSNAIGKNVVFNQEPLEQVREYSAEHAMMYDWFNLRGYSADISDLRNIIVDLDTFEDWVDKAGWHKAAA
ncbi:NmrA/HSCARG family protein [Chitinispirillales bacterium ANBcel5]|uniref:NmrA/HSCARG family protein n=1 Tax=Cellulosispirillum alkaliphilum TaxID=3039283 RepID=UPI002A4FD8D7|nr:NmrA/HSCARG family protein [Chitinispirillales bacterium ANBcel5]